MDFICRDIALIHFDNYYCITMENASWRGVKESMGSSCKKDYDFTNERERERERAWYFMELMVKKIHVADPIGCS